MTNKIQELFDFINLAHSDEWDPEDIERVQNGEITFDSQFDAYQSGLYDGERDLASQLIPLSTEAKEEIEALLLKKYSIPDVIELLHDIVDDAHHKGIPFNDCIFGKISELTKLYKEQ